MASRFRWTLFNNTDSTSEILGRDPVGWDDLEIQLKRHPTYKSVLSEFSLNSLRYHCGGGGASGGKEFLDSAFDTYGPDAEIEILIEIACDGTGTYTELYRGLLDFNTYKKGRMFTSCGFLRSGLYDKIISRDSISVNLESTVSVGQTAITAPQTTTLGLPSMEILFQDRWGVDQDYNYGIIQTDDIFWFTFTGGLLNSNITDSFEWTEYSEVGTALFESTAVSPIVTFNDDRFTYPQTVNYSVDLHLDFFCDITFEGFTGTNIEFKLWLFYGKKDPNINPSLQFVTLFDDSGFEIDEDGYTKRIDLQTSGSIQVEQGDSIWLVWVVNNEDSPNTYNIQWFWDESTFEIYSNTLYRETEAKTILVHEAFNQTIDSIADTDNKFYSDFFGRTDSDKQTYSADGCGSLLAITSGLCIREFEEPEIFCSLQDLFASLDAIYNLGLGIETDQNGIEFVRVEPVRHFFDNATPIITLNNVVDLVTEAHNESRVNRAIIGYDRWESEFNGGIDEPCTRHEYSTKINGSKGEYSKLSRYLASTYALEFTRRKNVSLTREDWRYDHNNFFIALIRTAYGLAPEFYDDSFNSGAGMVARTTAYNLRLTPARMIQPHLKSIVIALQKIGGDVRFVRGDGNIYLVAAQTVFGYAQCGEEYSSQSLYENQSFPYNDSNVEDIAPLYLPERYRFKYPLTNGMLQTIRNNPHGYITFTADNDGNTYHGFIESVNFKLQTGETFFTLLKAPI